MRDLPTIARELREFLDTSGIMKISRDGAGGVLATAGKAMRLQELLAELDQRLAAGAEAPKQAVPSYQRAYEANCALVAALDRVRDILDGKASASDMGIHEIVNRALELHRLAAPPAPSSEQPKEATR